AWAGLGIRDEAERAQVLADQLRDSVSTAIELRGRFRRKGTWIVTTLGAVAVAVLVASGWLPSLFGRLTTGVTGPVGLLPAVGLGVRWATKASAALGQLNQAATEIRRLATEEAEKDLTAAFEELHAAEARESVTRSQLAQVDAQVAALTHQLAELMPGQRLYSFIVGRAASDAYTTHLGLISTIPPDFQQLVHLLPASPR